MKRSSAGIVLVGLLFLLHYERVFAYTDLEYLFEVRAMKDWREELRSTEPVVTRPKDPSLCSCMANMKGRWIGGKYTCIRCGKPVYDAYGKR